jgi:hypothetical protein
MQFRKNSLPRFPTTFEYELHLSDVEKGSKTTYSTKPSLNLVASFHDFSAPLVTSFESLAEVCIQECVNSVVVVGGVVIQIGDQRESSKASGVPGSPSYYKTIRLWQSSLVGAREYINLTAWGKDVDCFERAQIGDFVVAERVRVISFKGGIQLASMHHSLYHFNVALDQANQERAEWKRKVEAARAQEPRFAVHQDPGVPELAEEQAKFLSAQVAPSKQAKKRQRTIQSTKITDFFKRANPSSVQLQPITSTPQQQVTPFASATKRNYAVAMPQVPLEIEIVSGRFSISDALQLQDNQRCWIVACLNQVFAKSPRGECIYNCLVCSRSASSCSCTENLQSFTWKLYVIDAWMPDEHDC